jgi:hypothetical protein
MWLIQEILCNCNWSYKILVLDVIWCSVAYSAVFFFIVLYLFTVYTDVINNWNNTVPNIMMIYESWFDRDVKGTALALVLNGPGIDIERLREPPPSPPLHVESFPQHRLATETCHIPYFVK